jgi:hypothetical protein
MLAAGAPSGGAAAAAPATAIGAAMSSAAADLAAAREILQRASSAEEALVLGLSAVAEEDRAAAETAIVAAGSRVACAKAAVREHSIRLRNAVSAASASAVSRVAAREPSPPRRCGKRPASLAELERTVPAPDLGWLCWDGSVDVELASRALQYAADLEPAWAVADAITALMDECTGALQASPACTLEPGTVLRRLSAALAPATLSIARINERAKGLLVEYDWGSDVAREFLADCPAEAPEVERRLRRARAAVAERNL